MQNTGTLTIPGVAGSVGSTVNQVPIMANVYYDFMAGQTIVPYIGAGVGIAFNNMQVGNFNNSNSRCRV